MTNLDVFMLVVAIILGAIVIAFCAIGIVFDVDNNASDRRHDRYRRLREKIMSPKNQKYFFKRIRWFKKLLRNKHNVTHIVDDVVWVRKVQVEAQYNPRLDIEEELKVFPWKVQANEMWKLADQRQLYSAKELKFIDAVNAAIDKEVAETVAQYEKAKAAQEAREAARKACEDAEARARAQRVAESPKNSKMRIQANPKTSLLIATNPVKRNPTGISAKSHLANNHSSYQKSFNRKEPNLCLHGTKTLLKDCFPPYSKSPAKSSASWTTSLSSVSPCFLSWHSS